MFLTLLGFGLSTTVFASPLSFDGAANSIDARGISNDDYDIVCNTSNLDMNDIQLCINKFWATGASTITVPKNGDNQMCLNGSVHVSGRALDNNGVSETGRNIGFGTSNIMAKCGTRGGSGPAYTNDNFIIHIKDAWVKRDEPTTTKTAYVDSVCANKTCPAGCEQNLTACMTGAGSNVTIYQKCVVDMKDCYVKVCRCEGWNTTIQQNCLNNCQSLLLGCESGNYQTTSSPKCQSVFATCVHVCNSLSHAAVSKDDNISVQD